MPTRTCAVADVSNECPLEASSISPRLARARPAAGVSWEWPPRLREAAAFCPFGFGLPRGVVECTTGLTSIKGAPAARAFADGLRARLEDSWLTESKYSRTCSLAIIEEAGVHIR